MRNALERLQYATIVQHDFAPPMKEKCHRWTEGFIRNRNAKGLSREGKVVLLITQVENHMCVWGKGSS
jgi:hypothetical protein